MAGSNLIKEILTSSEARVAEYLISPRSAGRPHRHSIVFEELICLAGKLRVEIDGQTDSHLASGDKAVIPAGTNHCVFNDNDGDARFLVIQGGGKFDYISCEE